MLSGLFQQPFVPLHRCCSGQSCCGMHGAGAGWAVGVQSTSVTPVLDPPQVAKRIGYPLMIKAAEGGGGKGIRKVEAAEELGTCFRQVRGAQEPHPCPHPLLGHTAGSCSHSGWLALPTWAHCRTCLRPGLNPGRGGCWSTTLSPAAGTGRGARFLRLPDEAGAARAAPGGASAGRRVRQRHLPLRPRLLHPAPAPEDH